MNHVRTCICGFSRGASVERSGRGVVKALLAPPIAAVCDGPNSVPTAAPTAPFRAHRNYARDSFRFDPTIDSVFAALSAVMEKPDCMKRKLLRRILAQFCPMISHNVEIYSEVDMLHRRMTREKHQHVAPPLKYSKFSAENRPHFLGHIIRRSSDRLVEIASRMLSDLNCRRPPRRRRKFWTEVVKEDLLELGIERRFKRDVTFRGNGIATGGQILCAI
ncbi:hypothetical protein RB195_013215 [Necator americanus]|uniref:Uncharacterized protein n=1 Tax=Necator americanus TaxID=51031 RepID=A0ABR1DV45_NECAM